MSVTYHAVGWSTFKKRYDLILWLGIVLFLVVFCGVSLFLFPKVTLEILLIRAFGSAAFLLLHIILCIGPLARLHRHFLPLLYNRRHMGVSLFILALLHGFLSWITYHAGGDLNPFVSLIVSDAGPGISRFPFQIFGVMALVILFLMAATSHDFWLVNLTAPFWKAMHMLVYAAYAFLVVHVVFGAIQAETHGILTGLVGGGMVVVLGLHLVSGWREHKPDNQPLDSRLDQGFIEACRVADIPENRARIVSIAGERVAIFKYDGKVCAVSNVCQHQNGPLGEGKIVHGCITCPWHGYQYLPETGASPPPFVEKIPIFKVKIQNGIVHISALPEMPGTYVEPASIEMEGI